MSLQRTCYLCGKPVSIRRRMSLFCSERCEHRHRFVMQAPPGPSGAAGADAAPPEAPLRVPPPRPPRPPSRS
jgi:hypothetical protein